ncbi:MAG: hypothetical protein R3F44_01370 [Candidatus Competibacteraceae bacterium]
MNGLERSRERRKQVVEPLIGCKRADRSDDEGIVGYRALLTQLPQMIAELTLAGRDEIVDMKHLIGGRPCRIR